MGEAHTDELRHNCVNQSSIFSTSNYLHFLLVFSRHYMTYYQIINLHKDCNARASFAKSCGWTCTCISASSYGANSWYHRVILAVKHIDINGMPFTNVCWSRIACDLNDAFHPTQLMFAIATGQWLTAHTIVCTANNFIKWMYRELMQHQAKNL